MPNPYNVQHGIIHVGPLYNHGARVFENGVDAIAALNCENIGVFMSPNDDGRIAANQGGHYVGQDWGLGAGNLAPANTLTELAQTAPFVYLFSHPTIKRYFIKTWTYANSIGDNWRVFANEFVMDNEYSEMKAFVQHLLSTYSNKEFILQTSESDWSYIGPGFDGRPQPLNHGVANRLTAFLSARIRAVEDARVGIVSSSKVFSSVEMNLVRDDPMHRVHNDVLWRLDPDMFSLTVYEAINDFLNPNLTGAQVISNMVAYMRKIVGNIRRAMRIHRGEGYANKPIYIGEYGWPENSYWMAVRYDVNNDPYDFVALMDALFAVCDELGIPYAMFWQLWDNEERDFSAFGDVRPQPVVLRRCVYDELDNITVQGTYLSQLLAP